MTIHDRIDIAIIRGGPTGSFAPFFVLYPEKLTFDVGRFRNVLAKDLEPAGRASRAVQAR